MDKRETLLALASRVEAAEGASRSLDNEVRLATNNGCAFGDDPAYSASLDAAMTLVPEGWQGDRISWWAGCDASCTLEETHFVDGEWVREFGWLGRVESKAATPALALTAACLRALASQETRYDG